MGFGQALGRRTHPGCDLHQHGWQDGKVCETLTIWDVAGTWRGLGLLPDL
ncbi:MAG: hypothetical protein V9H69_26480 [Anaerolineae bacterium]